ncbi:MAG: hypothetical protein GX088_03690 [Clostridia bacterium]|nr:hypothetical protein [Clostridia bacterium]
MNGITVNEALELLKGHGVILKAGRNGLSNIIETVSVLEVELYQQWLQGGELYLTALSAFQKKDQVYQLIRDLKDAGSAALAVHPGNKQEVFLDDHAYALAEELNFPILILPKSIPYSSVLTTVMEAILDKQKIMLERSQELNRYLTNMLLAGGGFKGIAESLREVVKKPVVIADGTGHIVAEVQHPHYDPLIFRKEVEAVLQEYAGRDFPDKRIIDEGKLNIKFSRVSAFDGREEIIVVSVFMGTTSYGYVVLPEPQETEECHLEMLLTHTGTAVALEISKNLAVKKVEEQLNLEFIDDLLSRNYSSEEAIIRRAEQRGLDLEGKYVVLIVEIDNYEEIYLKYLQENYWIVQLVKDRLHNAVDFAVKRFSKKSVTIPKGERVIVLQNIPNDVKQSEVKTLLYGLAQEIQKEVEEELENIPVSIGIGSLCSKITDFPLSFHHAEQALEIGWRIKGGSGIFDYQELGIYSLLLTFGNEKLKDSCRKKLQKLIEYDANHNSELLKTMETYLDCGENINKTAETLFIHPNTVKYRLERIKKIMEKDPFKNGEEKLSYYFSIKALKVL